MTSVKDNKDENLRKYPKCYFSNNKSVEIFSVDLADNTNVDHEDRASVLEQKVFEPV